MMVAQISSSYMIGEKTITTMVYENVHWSKRRILFSVRFACEGFFPG